jgi:hypothetical protein
VTLGQNPTRLVRANGEVKLLRRGEDSQLEVGDKVRAVTAVGVSRTLGDTKQRQWASRVTVPTRPLGDTRDWHRVKRWVLG